MNKNTAKNFEEKAQMISQNVLNLRQMDNLQKCSLKILSLITQIKYFVQNIKIQLQSQKNQNKQRRYQKKRQEKPFMQTRVKQIQYLELQLEKLKQLINFTSEKSNLVKQFVIKKVLKIIERMQFQHFLNKIKYPKQDKQTNKKQQNFNLKREKFHNFVKFSQKQLEIKRSRSQKYLQDKSQTKIKQSNLNRLKSQYKQIKQSQEMRLLTCNIKKIKNIFQNNRLKNSNHLNKSILKNKFGQLKRKLTLNKKQDKKILIEWNNQIKNSETQRIQDIISINLQSSQKHFKQIQNNKKSNVQLLKILPNKTSLSSFNSCQKKPQVKEKKLLNQVQFIQNPKKHLKLKQKSQKKLKQNKL